MKKLFVAVVLVSAAAACGSKKADTTPRATPTSNPGDTGGAGYGGAAYGGHAKAPAANPCSATAH